MLAPIAVQHLPKAKLGSSNSCSFSCTPTLGNSRPISAQVENTDIQKYIHFNPI